MVLVFGVGVLSNFLIDSGILPISGENSAFFPNCTVIFLQIGNSGSWVPLKLKSMGHLWNSWVPYRNALFSE